MSKNEVNESLEYIYTFEQKIIAEVVNKKEEACIQAIYKWAEMNGVDEVLLCDEDKLREVLKLGLAEYIKVHGD